MSSSIPSPGAMLYKYEEFVAQNANSVAQIESALRSLTYIIPGMLHGCAARTRI